MINEAADLADMEQLVRFTVNVNEIQSDCLTSSEISLNSMPWHIKLCRTSSDNPIDYDIDGICYVDVELVSPFNEYKVDFACEAQAIFKLLPNNKKNGTPIIRNITKQKFDHSNPSYEFESFVEWKQLLNEYTTKNEATFEILLSTGPASRKLMLEPISSKFLVIVGKVDNSEESYAPEIVLRGIRWTIMTERVHEFYTISLTAKTDDIDTYWATNVAVTITLLSDLKEKSRTTANIYTYDWKNLVKRQEFIRWNEFMDPDNKFVENDAAMFRVELSVAPPKPLWNIDF